MFRAGQDVICVDDSPPDIKYASDDPTRLVRGRIYKVDRAYLRSDDKEPLVALVGISEKYKPYNGWRASRFRPIKKVKTEISIFTKMLEPRKKKARV